MEAKYEVTVYDKNGEDLSFLIASVKPPFSPDEPTVVELH